MKLSRIQLVLVIVIGVLVVGNGLLLYLSDRGGKRSEQLNDELALVVQRLRGMELTQGEGAVEAELAKMKQELAETSSPFPKDPPSLELCSYLVDSALANNVELLGFAQTKTSIEKIGETSYESVPYRVTARGGLENLDRFTSEVEGAAFPIMKTDDLSLRAGPNGWEASFNIVVLIQTEIKPEEKAQKSK